MDSREQLIRRIEYTIGDMIHDNMRNGLGAEEWRQIFAVVFAGEFGDGSSPNENPADMSSAT